jgi:UDP-2,3-diacylglucosamine hydrolase
LAEAAAPSFRELPAPPGWRTAEFISDLHLQASEPATFDAWRRYMAASTADAVFILGDLFEAWPGDDAAFEPGFDADCAGVLRAAAAQRPVFFMHGNRDFLVGRTLLDACGVTLLDDPTVLGFHGQRWLLTHGDLLCTGDQPYLAFRAHVRDPAWQQAVLARPLAERRALARSLREQSAARQLSGDPYADVDEALATKWLQAAGAGTMIHGHTHRPRDHRPAAGLARIVLSDWDAAASPPRAEVLRLDATGAHRAAFA